MFAHFAMPLANQGPPTQKMSGLSGDQLAIRLKADPSILPMLQNQAVSLYNQARHLWGITAAIDAIWGEFRSRTIQADRDTQSHLQPTAAARIALEASALFGDLLSLPLPYPNPLAIYNAPQLAGEIADTPEARALLESRPSTKAWLHARDARRDAATAIQGAAVEQAQRDAPRNFLETMRARGIALEVDENGAIVLPPGADASKVLPHEIETMKQWKPELVALLQAKAAARLILTPSAPTVLA